MKRKLKNMLLILFKYHLRFIYFFIKLFTVQKRRVFFLSRQFDSVPYNYQKLIDELESDGYQTRVICKKVASGLNSALRNEKKHGSVLSGFGGTVGYYFNLYKQMHYAATSKVIIVDGYNAVASLLKHKRNTKVIQLWHALAAIKKFGYQTIGYADGLDPDTARILCMHKNYDYIISGSVAMNKYFAEAFNTDISKLRAFGTPMVDYMLKDNKKIINKIYKRYPSMKKKLNILYSPTFRSDGRDNSAEVINAFDTDKYNLIITFHPKVDQVKSDKNVICIDRNEFSTLDILRVCDYVITDYSALAIDACVLNKKLLLYVYDYEQYDKENGINIDLFKELKGNVSKDIKDIVKIIDNNKYNIDSYNKFRKKYLTVSDGTSTLKIVELIEENL